MKTPIVIVGALILAFAFRVAAEKEHPHVLSQTTNKIKYEAERSTEYWVEKAQSILAEKLKAAEATKTTRAKNIILFLGDGMSVHTITASRNLMGDSSDQLSFDKFPYLGLSKTYCIDRQVADSACTSTAYLGGVKGNYGTIGVNAQVPRYDCKLGQNPINHVESIAKWAQDAGMDTGFVTTARVTHASPAGTYAHTSNRNWENDYEVTLNDCNPNETIDIARQLVEWPVGKKLKVIMGGGRSNFINRTVNDEEGKPGLRLDGRNLIKDWLHDKQSRNLSASYVWSRKGLNLLNLDKTDYILGLFSSSHCPYHGDLKRNFQENADPSLTEMTEAAIKLLQKNDKGFFLFVEGARIDMAHHETRARKSLEDTVEFSNAVQKAVDMTSADDTLIVVTADHSHTMTINGYPTRDQEITGFANEPADDGKPYTILSYANGPGYYNTFSKQEGRNVISKRQILDAQFEYTAAVPLNSETHGGDDVSVLATGPYAQYFTGNYEQTMIPAMMAKASQIGRFANVQ